MLDNKRQKVIEILESMITPNKKALMNQALVNRTRHITVVLENIQKPHNASAVLRTIECLGLQDFHIIEIDRRYKVNLGVAKGAGKWVDIHQYKKSEGSDTLTCINALKEQGYKICVTSPHAEGISIEEIPLDQKLALFFGNERRGLSKVALDYADVHISLPMWGFTESYNLSVSAAICFYNLISRLRNSEVNWQLSEDEKYELKVNWVRKIVARADIIEREILKKENSL